MSPTSAVQVFVLSTFYIYHSWWCTKHYSAVDLPWQHPCTWWRPHSGNPATYQSYISRFGRLLHWVYLNHNLFTSTEILFYRAIFLSTLLYGCKSWIPYRRQIKALKAFYIRCLQSILGIRWWHKITYIGSGAPSGAKTTLIATPCHPDASPSTTAWWTCSSTSPPAARSYDMSITSGRHSTSARYHSRIRKSQPLIDFTGGIFVIPDFLYWTLRMRQNNGAPSDIASTRLLQTVLSAPPLQQSVCVWSWIA